MLVFTRNEDGEMETGVGVAILYQGASLVTAGFRDATNDCDNTADMIDTITFPVEYVDQNCYFWPGHSGEN